MKTVSYDSSQFAKKVHVHVQMHDEACSFHWHSSLQAYRSMTILYTDKQKAVCVEISAKTRSYRDTRTLSVTISAAGSRQLPVAVFTTHYIWCPIWYQIWYQIGYQMGSQILYPTFSSKQLSQKTLSSK